MRWAKEKGGGPNCWNVSKACRETTWGRLLSIHWEKEEMFYLYKTFREKGGGPFTDMRPRSVNISKKSVLERRSGSKSYAHSKNCHIKITGPAQSAPGYQDDPSETKTLMP